MVIVVVFKGFFQVVFEDLVGFAAVGLFLLLVDAAFPLAQQHVVGVYPGRTVSNVVVVDCRRYLLAFLFETHALG